MRWWWTAEFVLRPGRQALMIYFFHFSILLLCTGDAYIPVPFEDIFPSDVTEGGTTFDVEFDPDEGPMQGQEGAGTSSKIKIDDKENDEAFGEVCISCFLHKRQEIDLFILDIHRLSKSQRRIFA